MAKNVKFKCSDKVVLKDRMPVAELVRSVFGEYATKSADIQLCFTTDLDMLTACSGGVGTVIDTDVLNAKGDNPTDIIQVEFVYGAPYWYRAELFKKAV